LRIRFTIPCSSTCLETTACLRIGRGYYDLIEERTMEASANFVESLTHGCYIVQTSRITGRLRTPFDRLLSVFEQKNFMDKTQASKRYDHPISDEEIKEIVDILHYLSVDPDGRKELDDEQYYREYLDATFGPLYAKIDEKTQKLIEKETEIAAKDAELSVKDAEIAELKEKLKQNNV